MPATTAIPPEILHLDTIDPLAAQRAEFHLPAGVIYLDGNSLGPLQHRVKARLERVIEQQWGQQLIRSWTGEADWMHLPDRVAGKIAKLIGARPEEVAVSDSTGVNTFKALVQARAGAEPGRRVILAGADNFPADL